MASSCPLFCFFLVIAGNFVSGYTSSIGSEEKECFATVEMVRMYLMKDSVQQFVSSTLKQGCLAAYSNHKDSSHMQCDQKVKVFMSNLDNFVFTKLQPKELCHLRNYTGNGVGKEQSIGGVVCVTAVSFIEYLLTEQADAIANISAGVCSFIPLPSFLFPCKDLVIQFVLELIKDLGKDVNPQTVCNVSQGY